MVDVAVTLTSTTLEDLAKRIQLISPTMTDRVQFDMVDGKFAPNKTLTLKNVKRVDFGKPLELHLMVEEPEHYFADMVLLRPERVYFHLEGTKNPNTLLGQLKHVGIKAGLAIKVETPISALQPFLGQIASALILAVTPGFYGSAFQPLILQKIQQLRALAPNLDIEVDGGINLQTGAECVKAGATTLASGSFIYKSPDVSIAIQSLKSL